jgi:hypothetical protein
MKNFKSLNTLAFIIFFTLLNACNSQEELPLPETRNKLKSASDIIPNGAPQSFSLLSEQNQVGEIQVSNDDEFLRVEFIAGEYLSFYSVQFWVGTSTKKVPLNKQEMPVALKFKYKAVADDDKVFLIPLSEIYTPDPEIACEPKKLYLFAHAAADICNTEEIEEISAWSEGTLLGNSQTVTYSTYTTKCKSTGGGGCFPHKAWGGNDSKDGVYYYNNITAGIQNIYADNGDIAGKVQYNAGTLTFSFDQNWMFSGAQPLLKIHVFYMQGGKPTVLFEGEPTSSMGIYSVNIGYYPYYLIQFNLQYCYAGNP